MKIKRSMNILKRRLAATSETEAIEFWKKAQWDGTTGLSAKGDAPWAWLVNIDHLYLVKDGLDIGEQRIHATWARLACDKQY